MRNFIIFAVVPLGTVPWGQSPQKECKITLLLSIKRICMGTVPRGLSPTDVLKKPLTIVRGFKNQIFY